MTGFFPKTSKWSKLLLRPWRILFAGRGPEGFLMFRGWKRPTKPLLTVRIGKKNSCYSVANNVCWGFWTAFLDSVMNMNKPQRHAVNAYRFYMGYWCIQNYNHRLGNIQQDNLHTIIHHSFVSIHHPSVPLWNGTSLKVFWYIHHSLQTLCTAASAGAFAGGRANLSESSPWTLEISWVAVFFFQK